MKPIYNTYNQAVLFLSSKLQCLLSEVCFRKFAFGSLLPGPGSETPAAGCILQLGQLGFN